MSDGDSSDGGETKRLLRKLFGNGRKSKWDIPNKYLTDSDDDDDVVVGGDEDNDSDIDDDDAHRQAPASPSAAQGSDQDVAEEIDPYDDPSNKPFTAEEMKQYYDDMMLYRESDKHRKNPDQDEQIVTEMLEREQKRRQTIHNPSLTEAERQAAIMAGKDTPEQLERIKAHQQQVADRKWAEHEKGRDELLREVLPASSYIRQLNERIIPAPDPRSRLTLEQYKAEVGDLYEGYKDTHQFYIC